MNKKNIFFLLLFFLLCFSCGKNKSPQQERSFPIKKAVVQVKDVPIYIDSIGHVTPRYAIDIKSRVEGELIEVYFKEGQDIKKDDLLFLIDPRPFQNDLEKAEGTLLENLANLHLAKEKVARYSKLIKDDYVAQFDFDSYISKVELYEALVKQNKAEIEQAKLNLEYCSIYSPVDGRTGILQIDKGNLVPIEGSTPLISINQITPIYVILTVPENELPRIRKYHEKGTLKIHVAFEDLAKDFIEGRLDMLDNEVNENTAMIRIRAIFENQDKMLWPGKFVKTRLILTTRPNSLIVPFQAIQITTTGPVVFVIKKDNTIEMRNVVLGQREDENIIIIKGLTPGEEVVTEGQLNLFAGAKVFVSKD